MAEGTNRTSKQVILRKCWAAVGLVLLSACGGGALPGGSSPSSAEFVSNFDLEDATVAFRNGVAVPTEIRVDGVTRPALQAVANSNIYSDGTNVFRVASGADGASYAIVGMSFTGEHLGSLISGATSAPTSGSVIYSGTYNAELNGPFTAQFYSVEGIATVGADFDNGTAAVLITDRQTDFAVAGYDNDQLEADLTFVGTVDANGVIRGTQSGGQTTGITTGIAYQTGAVGTVAVGHQGAATGNRIVRENGVFAAN